MYTNQLADNCNIETKQIRLGNKLLKIRKSALEITEFFFFIFFATRHDC